MTKQDPTIFFETLELIKEHFHVKDAYLWNNIPTYIIDSSSQLEEKMDVLRKKLKTKDLRILLRKERTHLLLQVIPMPAAPPPTKRFFSLNYSFLLFIITIIAVTISGYFTAKNHITILTLLEIEVDAQRHLLELTTAYTISIMAVLSLHELGHIIAFRRHQIETSHPIFMPGIPLVTPGTFGAVIIQKSPVVNRNQLFDIGLIGPLVGFIVSIIFSLIGYSLSIPISKAEYQSLTTALGEGQSLFLPLLFERLSPYILPNPDSYTHILHPIAFAGWITTLLAFLNIFPIGQLDGGHISHALFGAKWHRRISYVMILVMILAGWWTMALFSLFFLRREHPGTLDEKTSVSNGRKIMAFLAVIIFLSCFTLSPDSPLLYLLFM